MVFKSSRSKLILAVIIGMVVLLLDQWSKQCIRTAFFYGEARSVIDGFFSLVYVRNPGAAWGIFAGKSWALILVSLGVLVMLVVYRRSILNGTLLSYGMYGLMMGGIAGNLIDRVRFAWVTDFLSFHFGAYEYPSFNVADSAICVAVALYFWMSLRASKAASAAEAA